MGAIVVMLALSERPASAQFTTVINAPPTIIGSNQSIGSDTQLNVLTGGFVGENFSAGASDGSSTNVEVNISGGVVNRGFDANGGSVVNISGGIVHQQFSALFGSEVNITGGLVDQQFLARNGSVVNVSGGILGDRVFVEPTADLTVVGNEFRVDGVLVPGLETIGNMTNVNMMMISALTGTLADGTTFTFSLDNDADGLFTPVVLKAAAVPAVGPAMITVPSDAAPASIRGGQTLTVNDGGFIAGNFHAGHGSNVVINGGNVGLNFEASGAVIDIHGGTIGPDFDAFHGSVVTIDGGTIGDDFVAGDGSTVSVSGGVILGMFANRGSEVDISGGTMGDGVSAGPDAMMKISGGEFHIDGVPIAGLDTIGNSVAVNIPGGSVFSGTLADGTPFAFHGQDGDSFFDGTLTLEAAALPAVTPGVISVPTDAAPAHIRSGQILHIAAGGEVGDNFSAAVGTIVVMTGGRMGSNFEATGAHVSILDGMVGFGFDALYGTTVDVTGGVIDSNFEALNGSVVNIAGGSVVHGFHALSGSTVNISGGTVGPFFQSSPGSKVNISGGMIANDYRTHGEVNISGGEIGDEMEAFPGSVVSMSGGELGDNALVIFVGSVMNVAGGQIGAHFAAGPGSEVNISGGSFGENFSASGEGIGAGNEEGSTINLFGTQFILNGVDITSSLTANQPFTIVDRDVPLTGLLADGSPIDFFLKSTFDVSEDYFDDTATLTVTLVDFLPGDFNRDGVVDTVDFVVWRNAEGQEVDRGTGGDANFDGLVNRGDYDLWRARFGRTAGTGSLDSALLQTSVPEPGAFLLAIIGCLAALRKRRR